MARNRGKRFEHNGNLLRSKFEYKVALQLEEAGIDYEYETEQYEYFTKVQGGVCDDCLGTHVHKRQWYTPDFFLPNGIIIEAKGFFTAANRATILAVREAHAPIDLRLMFMANNKINRNSITRYSDWCEKYNIIYAIRKIPESWMK